MLTLAAEFAQAQASLESLTEIGRTIAQSLPRWSRHAFLWDAGISTSVDLSGAGSLQEALLEQRARHRDARAKFRQSLRLPDQTTFSETIEIRSEEDDTTVVLEVADRILRMRQDSWAWANTVSFQFGRRIGDESGSAVAEATLGRLAERFEVAFGRVCLRDEYFAYNMDLSRGARAIGLDIALYVPGLYWLNFFGPPYLPMLDTPRISAIPAYEVRSVGHGIMVKLDKDPLNWKSEPYQRRRREVANALGSNRFFDRSQIDRGHASNRLSQMLMSYGATQQSLTSPRIPTAPRPSQLDN